MIAVKHSIIENIRKYLKIKQRDNDLYDEKRRIEKEISDNRKSLEKSLEDISGSEEFKEFVEQSSKNVIKQANFYFEVDGSMVNIWYSGAIDNHLTIHKEPLYKSGLEIGADKMKKIPTSS